MAAVFLPGDMEILFLEAKPRIFDEGIDVAKEGRKALGHDGRDGRAGRAPGNRDDEEKVESDVEDGRADEEKKRG